jgi:hypothetical protein
MNDFREVDFDYFAFAISLSTAFTAEQYPA